MSDSLICIGSIHANRHLQWDGSEKKFYRVESPAHIFTDCLVTMNTIKNLKATQRIGKSARECPATDVLLSFAWIFESTRDSARQSTGTMLCNAVSEITTNLGNLLNHITPEQSL